MAKYLYVIIHLLDLKTKSVNFQLGAAALQRLYSKNLEHLNRSQQKPIISNLIHNLCHQIIITVLNTAITHRVIHNKLIHNRISLYRVLHHKIFQHILLPHRTIHINIILNALGKLHQRAPLRTDLFNKII